jgi:hypothetical protein
MLNSLKKWCTEFIFMRIQRHTFENMTWGTVLLENVISCLPKVMPTDRLQAFFQNVYIPLSINCTTYKAQIHHRILLNPTAQVVHFTFSLAHARNFLFMAEFNNGF